MLTHGKARLGEILVSEKVVTKEELEKALEKQGPKKRRLGKVLIDMGLTTEEAIAGAISRQLDIPYMDLEGFYPPPDIINLLDKGFISENLIIPIELEEGELTVAVSDPKNLMALDEASFKTGLKIKPVVSTERGVLKCIERTFRVNEHIQQMMKAFSVKEDITFLALPQDREVDVHRRFRLDGSSQAMRMLAFIITDAFNRKASDILIEPAGDRLRLRYRIMGDLVNMISLPALLKDPLLYHIKIISNLDLANRKSPQTGKSRLTLANRSILLEVATIPAAAGERVSISIYDGQRPALSFKEMGVRPAAVKDILGLAKGGHGLILFVGPKGSGRSTAMYAMIKEFISDRLDVVTIQEHTSCHLPGATQIEQGEFSTAETIKYSTLNRPDVIMLERIEDAAAAGLAMHAASEGSLVLAGVMGSGPAEAINRLLTLGTDPRALASSLTGIVGLRLIKTICPGCKEAYVPDMTVLGELGLDMPGAFYHGVGCKSCMKTGYLGHAHVVETIDTSGQAASLIASSASTEELRSGLSGLGKGSIFTSVWELVREGRTTVEELMRKVPPAYWPDKAAGERPGPAIKKVAASPTVGTTKPPEPRKPAEEIPAAVLADKPAAGPAPMEALLPSESFRNVMRQYKIMLAISDSHDLEKIKDCLTDADMQPVVASDGSHALDLLYAEDPDVLICDMRIPDMQNLLAYKKLYDTQRRYVPVISIVRGSMEHYNDIDGKLGVEIKLLRPINTKTLMAKVSDLLAEYTLGDDAG